MDKLIERLPDIISAAAQSHLGILALLSVALSLLAYFFFAKASEKVKVGIFVLLFLGVIGFGVAMFRVSPAAPIAERAALSKEAGALLKQAALDPGGMVLFERFGETVDLHSNGISFLKSKADHRAVADWEAALDQLIQEGLLVPRGESREIFEITKKGYDTAQRTE